MYIIIVSAKQRTDPARNRDANEVRPIDRVENNSSKVYRLVKYRVVSCNVHIMYII